MDYDFPYLGHVIIPTDELIFFRGVGIPAYINVFFTTMVSTDPSPTGELSFGIVHTLLAHH